MHSVRLPVNLYGFGGFKPWIRLSWLARTERDDEASKWYDASKAQVVTSVKFGECPERPVSILA